VFQRSTPFYNALEHFSSKNRTRRAFRKKTKAAFKNARRRFSIELINLDNIIDWGTFPKISSELLSAAFLHHEVAIADGF
jgi:hypothetical protein